MVPKAHPPTYLDLDSFSGAHADSACALGERALSVFRSLASRDQPTDPGAVAACMVIAPTAARRDRESWIEASDIADPIANNPYLLPLVAGGEWDRSATTLRSEVDAILPFIEHEDVNSAVIGSLLVVAERLAAGLRVSAIDAAWRDSAPRVAARRHLLRMRRGEVAADIDRAEKLLVVVGASAHSARPAAHKLVETPRRVIADDLHMALWRVPRKVDGAAHEVSDRFPAFAAQLGWSE
jgi:hypothetical protein